MFNKSSKNAASKTGEENENTAPGYGMPVIRIPCRLCNRYYRDPQAPQEKTEKDIQDEIQSLFRQITASVTFLPQLDGHCTFNVLVYADADSDVPIEWGDSDAKEIQNGEKVQLRSFSTSNHRVDTLVSYKYNSQTRISRSQYH